MNAIVKMLSGFVIALLFTLSGSAQNNRSDSLSAFFEFTKLGEVYKQLPVQLDIHIHNSANPLTTESDTLKADLNLYYGKTNFYMRTEGLEEIVNDSLLIIINNQTKQIMLYPNNHLLKETMERPTSVFMPDSSAETLARDYSSNLLDAGKNIKRVEIRSRQNLYGTNLPKECFAVTYYQQPYEPLEFSRTKTTLVVVDSSVYARFQKNTAYEGKLVKTTSEKGEFFFMVKELTTTYNFKSIKYGLANPPVKEEDRVIKGSMGDYMPAKGFEDYVLTKEF